LAHGIERSSPTRNPSEHRGLLYVLLGVFGAWILSRWLIPTKHSDESNDTENNANDEIRIRQNPSSRPFKVAINSVPPPTPPTNEEKAEKERNRKYKTLKSLLELGMTVGTIGLLGVNLLLWHSTKQSIEISQKQLEMSERPWISVSLPLITEPLTIDSSGNVSTAIQFDAKNIGRTPAKEVIEEVPFVLTGGFVYPTLQKLCSVNAGDTSVSGPIGQTLFPNESLMPTSYSVTGHAIKLSPGTYGAGSFYSVVGCIIYKSFVSDQTYYSGFGYTISVKINGMHILTVHFANDGTITTVPPTKTSSSEGRLVIPAGGISLYPRQDGVIVK
jgi:hypothetical protein